MGKAFDREAAVEEFWRRKNDNRNLKREDNHLILAGGPVFAYCTYCGAEIVFSEKDNLGFFPKSGVCSECQELLDNNCMPEQELEN